MHSESSQRGPRRKAAQAKWVVAALELADTEASPSWPTNAAVAWDHECDKLRAAAVAGDRREGRRASEALRRIRDNWSDEASPNGKRPVRLMTLGQLRAEPAREVEWLVDGLLPVDGLSLLVAPPKVGKSTLARCLAVATGSGGEWLGRSVKRGAVIHLALEERPATVRGHYDDLEAPDEGIHVLLGQAPPPAERLEWLRTAITDTGATLVLIDPVQRWVKISDGNDYSTVTERLGPYIDLARELGVHLALVHHSRKGGGERGDEVLGSSAFFGSVDTIISLRVTEGRRVFYASGRDGVDIQKTLLTMNDSGLVSLAGTKAAADRADLARRIFEWLADQSEPVTKDKIRRGVRADQTQVVKALQQLVADQEVATTGRGVRGDPILYSVSDP